MALQESPPMISSAVQNQRNIRFERVMKLAKQGKIYAQQALNPSLISQQKREKLIKSAKLDANEDLQEEKMLTSQALEWHNNTKDKGDVYDHFFMLALSDQNESILKTVAYKRAGDCVYVFMCNNSIYAGEGCKWQTVYNKITIYTKQKEIAAFLAACYEDQWHVNGKRLRFASLINNKVHAGFGQVIIKKEQE